MTNHKVLRTISLQLYIIEEVAAAQAAAGGGVGVPLSDYRKRINCPVSTFHKHVRAVIERGWIKRLSRDRYAINPYYAFLFQDAVGRDA